MRFTIFWKENKPFLHYKNQKLIKEIGLLLKRIVHDFGQKLAIFHAFILVEIGKKYVVYDILERRNACVDNKNNKEKKAKK